MIQLLENRSQHAISVINRKTEHQQPGGLAIPQNMANSSDWDQAQPGIFTGDEIRS
jgi:hypothetical protein